MNRRTTQLLLAATALAAPALLSACGGASATTDDRADDRAPAPAAQAAPLGADQLLTDADTVYNDGADWFRLGTGDEDLSGNGDLAHPCLASSLSGTGATSVVRADFELRNTADPSMPVQGDSLTQLVGEYGDAEAARAAYDEVAGLVTACADRPTAITEYRSFEPRPIDIPGATAQVVDAHYGPLPDALADGDAAYIMETGLAVEGTRVVVLTSVIVGQDYNFLAEDGGTPVERMLPVAVDRLGS